MIILDRPRHADLIAEVRSTGARIKLISDGDVSAAIACAVQGTGVHAVMGIGGAPEGVITAAALRCLGGEIQARFRFRNDEERERAKKMLGHADEDRVYRTEDLAGGEQLVFAATGVTEGELLQGVRFFGGGARTHSLVMAYQTQAGPVRRHGPHVRPRPAAGRPALAPQRRPALAVPGAIGRAASAPSTATRRSRAVATVSPQPGGTRPRREVGERREHEQAVARPRRAGRSAASTPSPGRR